MSSHGVYGGKNESPGKAMARTWGYANVPRSSLYSKTHIVIASRDCGDIKFLLSLGVPAEHIIACDIDTVALVEASRYGVQISPHPRIEDTVRWALDTGYDVYSVNVDLCCSLLEAAPTVATIVSERIPLTLLTYRRGRDLSVIRSYPGLTSDEARLAYLTSFTGLMPTDQTTYHSFTRLSQGSAMGVCMWQQKKRPGRRAKRKQS